MAASYTSKHDNMPDLIDSYNIIQKKLHLFCCTSAESSTAIRLDNNDDDDAEPCGGRRRRRKFSQLQKLEATTTDQYPYSCGSGRRGRGRHGYGGQEGGMEEEGGGVVCSMCGDVGVAELLFFCSKCSYRPQHIYCSRSYPELGGEASICNWCLHEEDSLVSSTAKASAVLNGTNAHTKASKVNCTNVRANANAMHPIKEHINYSAAQGHGKAFEYLLLIAAQCLPQLNSENSAEIKKGIKQVNHTASMLNSTNPKMGSSDNKQGIKQEIKQANHTASMLNSTDPKMGSSDNKAHCHLDRKLNMGSIDNQANINNNQRLIMGLGSNKQVHSNINIKLDDKKDVDVYGGSMPKRLRCSKGINASFKCRKKGLQLSPSRPNYRRYKLLADVVC